MTDADCLLLVDSRSTAGTSKGDGGSVRECQTTESRTQATDDHHRQLYTTWIPGKSCSLWYCRFLIKCT